MQNQFNSGEITYENTLLSILQAAKQIRASDLHQLALQLQKVEAQCLPQVNATSQQETTRHGSNRTAITSKHDAFNP